MRTENLQTSTNPQEKSGLEEWQKQKKKFAMGLGGERKNKEVEGEVRHT